MSNESQNTIDVIVESHGSIVLFRILTPAADAFVDEFVRTEETQFFGNGLCCELRYASDLLNGMREHGLEVGG